MRYIFPKLERFTTHRPGGKEKAMDNPGTDRRSISISRFVLDLDRCALLDEGREIPLRPKTFEVLHFLVQNAGVVVSSRELLDAVWGDIVVTEDSVRQCVADARKALGDKDHDIIRTVPRRGYLFDSPADQAAPQGSRPVSQRFRPSWLLVAGISILLLAAVVFRFLGEDAVEPTVNLQPAANSVAVLRFADLSPDGNHGYLAAGLAEEILHYLAQSPSLRVIARTSSFAVEGDSIAAIGQQLNVANVLEGSIRRDGDRLRVSVQLVDTANSFHRWSRTYDVEYRNILAVQTEIAQVVASQLDVTLGNRKRGSTSDPQALEHFLQARFFYSRRGPDDVELAEDHYRMALDVDPAYAEAWAGLAAIANLRLHGKNPEADPERRAQLTETQRHAVEQALQYGPGLADIQMRAASYFRFNGERDRAVKHIEIARTLDPDNWLVLSADAARHLIRRRPEEAVDVMRQAVQLDPLNAVLRNNLAAYYFYAGQFQKALDQLREAERQYPNIVQSNTDQQVSIAKALILLERFEEALGVVQSLPAGWRSYGLALVYHALGSNSEAEESLAELQALPPEPGNLLAVAEVHAYRGESAQALTWLNRLKPHLLCFGGVMPIDAYYSHFLARLDDLKQWREAAATRMADCVY